jgi:hypothetical protein
MKTEIESKPLPRALRTLLVGAAVAAVLWSMPTAAHAAIYVTSDIIPAKIGKYASDGTTVNASLVSGLSLPFGIALSGSNLFVTNLSAGTIGKYTTTGATVNAALVSGLGSAWGIAVTDDGTRLFVVSNSVGTIGEYDATTGATINAALVSGLNSPAGIAVSGTSLFVTSRGSGTIGAYTTSGATVNPALVSGLTDPMGLALSGSNLFVANNGTIGKYTTTGATVNAALVASGISSVGIALSGSHLFAVNGGNSIGKYNATTGAIVNPALVMVSSPWALAVSDLIPGDFDDDLDVDVLDYLVLSANLHADVTLLTTEQSYLLGDLTADLQVDGHDYRAFRFAFEEANGAGSFVAMLAAIPEPSTGALAALSCGAIVFRRRPLRRALSR